MAKLSLTSGSAIWFITCPTLFMRTWLVYRIPYVGEDSKCVCALLEHGLANNSYCIASTLSSDWELHHVFFVLSAYWLALFLLFLSWIFFLQIFLCFLFFIIICKRAHCLGNFQSYLYYRLSRAWWRPELTWIFCYSF